MPERHSGPCAHLRRRTGPVCHAQACGDDRAPRAPDPTESACGTDGCQRPARVCRECVRALAFKWWGAIARHDIGGSRCELCEHTGGAIYCAEHALDAIVEHRAHMRQLGHRIGEPPPVDVTELLKRGRG